MGWSVLLSKRLVEQPDDDGQVLALVEGRQQNRVLVLDGHGCECEVSLKECWWSECSMSRAQSAGRRDSRYSCSPRSGVIGAKAHVSARASLLPHTFPHHHDLITCTDPHVHTANALLSLTARYWGARDFNWKTLIYVPKAGACESNAFPICK